MTGCEGGTRADWAAVLDRPAAETPESYKMFLSVRGPLAVSTLVVFSVVFIVVSNDIDSSSYPGDPTTIFSILRAVSSMSIVWPPNISLPSSKSPVLTRSRTARHLRRFTLCRFYREDPTRARASLCGKEKRGTYLVLSASRSCRERQSCSFSDAVPTTSACTSLLPGARFPWPSKLLRFMVSIAERASSRLRQQRRVRMSLADEAAAEACS